MLLCLLKLVRARRSKSSMIKSSAHLAYKRVIWRGGRTDFLSLPLHPSVCSSPSYRIPIRTLGQYSVPIIVTPLPNSQLVAVSRTSATLPSLPSLPSIPPLSPCQNSKYTLFPSPNLSRDVKQAPSPPPTYSFPTQRQQSPLTNQPTA